MFRFASFFCLFTLAGCTHDFGAFETTGDDATPSADSAQPETTADGALDSTAESAPADTSSVDSRTDGGIDTAIDTSLPIDTGPKCTDPGGALFAGHCYFPLTTASAWAAAKTSCAAAGGAHLVTITSAAEEAFVEGILSTDHRWIGLSRPTSAPPTSPSSFTWVTGETATFQKWATGEPNGSGECVRLRTSSDWADQSCTTAYVAICERE